MKTESRNQKAEIEGLSAYSPGWPETWKQKLAWWSAATVMLIAGVVVVVPLTVLLLVGSPFMVLGSCGCCLYRFIESGDRAP